MQGQGGAQGPRAARRRLRHGPRRRRLASRIQYQNANNSVRVTDEFMQAVDRRRRLAPAGRHRRRGHHDGPGPRPVPPDRRGRVGVRRPRPAVRHHDQPLAHRRTPPAASTAPTRAREYMHLDNSACNLASHQPAASSSTTTTRFDVEGFQAHRRGHLHRPGDPGRQRRLPDAERSPRPAAASASSASATPTSAPCSWRSACPTTPTTAGPGPPPSPSLMTGHAYATSARIASRMGPFAGFADNEEHMLGVLRMHRDAAAQHRRGAGARPSCCRAAQAGVGRRRGRRRGVRRAQQPGHRCWRPPAPSA